MFYYEFLEAIARIANKIKIFPNIERYQNRTDGSKTGLKNARKENTVKALPIKGLQKKTTFKGEDSVSDDDGSMNSAYEIDRHDISHIINVEGQPLYLKLEIFIKLCEFTILKRRNFYEFYED